MKPLGIICAVDTEYKPYLSKISQIERCDIGNLPIYKGTLSGRQIYLAFCGIAKANAALATALLINRFSCEYIINSGTAGALSANCSIGDVIVSTIAAYHDIDAAFMSDEARTFPETWFPASLRLQDAARHAQNAFEETFDATLHFGLVATGETFIDEGDHESIIKRMNPLSVDMETAAVAHACFILGAEFIAIRAITDTPASPGFDVYMQHREMAGKRAADFVELMLTRI
ncbi:MAG: 5'-methylthioadenosine/S-adenosylhomocysteine nucleosidase [Eggerthellaceae bacterium]|nr:5'-methylthioadenosine/S-adenosylhomocysteine nucleosidase [Eggerthellaceae bacterium]